MEAMLLYSHAYVRWEKMKKESVKMPCIWWNAHKSTTLFFDSGSKKFTPGKKEIGYPCFKDIPVEKCNKSERVSRDSMIASCFSFEKYRTYRQIYNFTICRQRLTEYDMKSDSTYFVYNVEINEDLKWHVTIGCLCLLQRCNKLE